MMCPSSRTGVHRRLVAWRLPARTRKCPTPRLLHTVIPLRHLLLPCSHRTRRRGTAHAPVVPASGVTLLRKWVRWPQRRGDWPREGREYGTRRAGCGEWRSERATLESARVPRTADRVNVVTGGGDTTYAGVGGEAAPTELVPALGACHPRTLAPRQKDGQTQGAAEIGAKVNEEIRLEKGYTHK